MNVRRARDSSGIVLMGALVLAATGVFAQPPSSAQPQLQTRWEDLVPKEWDPTKRFRQLDLGRLNDADPKAQQLMREMRKTWDNAPINSRMDGTGVRLPGYAVPLDTGAQGGLREFLLVPYFGACIHAPPPPANQIVHVLLDKPMNGIRTIDAVWVTGTLRAARQSTAMGMSGYTIRGAMVERYVTPASP